MTGAVDWARVSDLFNRVEPLAPPERDVILRDEAEPVRDQVRALLEAYRREGGRFSGSALEALRGADGLALPDEPRPGSRIGAYEVVREIGRGGMGIVFEAFRADDDYRKRVAIKLVGAGARTSAVMLRFRRERRILAQLEHPNIAGLLDGGLTPDGAPWFALEFVEGVPIDEYVRDRQLPLAGRIALLRQVCSALRYAHQRLVVHRDLKPGNILVAPDGTAKLLDFGVAKLLGGDDSGGGDETEVGARTYTPAFAAPEQLLGEPLTTACDIHGLGLVMYVVLTDRHPWRSRGESAADVRRRILNEPPPPTGLGPDLDAILGVALAKEPARRYAAAGDVDEDLRRYLAGLPLLARPGSRRERMAKFVRRHRAAVLSAWVALAAVVTGATATWWQAARARAEAVRAEAFGAFMRDILSAPDPGLQGREARVIDVVREATARLATGAVSDPVTRAAIERTLGATYNALGVPDTAAPLLERALATSRSSLGDGHVETALARVELARLEGARGRAAAADSLFRAGLAILRRHPARETDLANAAGEYGNMLFNAGRLDEAEPVLEEALAIARRRRTVPPQFVVNIINTLGLVREHRGDRAGAKARYREAIAISAMVPAPAAVSLVGPVANLANVLTVEDSLDLADSLQSVAVRNARAAYGERHAIVGAAMTGLGDIRRRRGRFDEAERTLQEALGVLQAALPPDHLQTVPALSLLGLLQCQRGRATSGEPLLRRALAIRQAKLPPGHWFIHNMESALSVCLVALGRPAEAESLALAGLEGLTKALGPDHPRVHETRERLETARRRR